ncbi:MAG: TetR/AcrR family transcriptional regulator [Sandaracinobacter sp.]
MAPADDRRTELLDAMADHVLSAGLAGSSLRPLARAAGTSDRMLLYYFPTKDALIAATLAHIARRLAGMLAASVGDVRLPPDSLLPLLADLTLAPRFRPYLGLFLEVASRAARGDTLCRTIGGEVAEGFLLWIEGQLITPADQRRAQAFDILTRIEGRMVLESLGVSG